MLGTRRLIADFFLVTHANRIARIKVHDAMILDIHARHAIAGRGHEEGVVKPDLERSRFDFAVPIRPAFTTETEVPFPDCAGSVSGLLEQRWQRRGARR